MNCHFGLAAINGVIQVILWFQIRFNRSVGSKSEKLQWPPEEVMIFTFFSPF